MGSIHVWVSMVYSPLRGMNGICLFWMDGGSEDRICNERFHMAPSFDVLRIIVSFYRYKLHFPPFIIEKHWQAIFFYQSHVVCIIGLNSLPTAPLE